MIRDRFSDLYDLAVAAVRGAMQKERVGYVVVNEDGTNPLIQPDGSYKYIAVKLDTPDNPEYTQVILTPGMVNVVRNNTPVFVKRYAGEWYLVGVAPIEGREAFGLTEPPVYVSDHNHQGSATGQGGQLNASLIFNAGAVPKARQAADTVYTGDSQTLTNKTLTSPVVNTGDINTPDIDGGTIDSTAIGATTPAAGRFTALALAASTELTISSGAVTATQSYHRIDTESNAATDDLVTINGGGATLNRLVIRAEDGGRTVVIKTTGNITTPGAVDITLDDTNTVVEMVYDTGLAKWQVISPAIGGGGAGAFTDLTDVPSSYTGHGSKLVAVKAAEDGLEFVEAGGGGTPLSVTTADKWIGTVLHDETLGSNGAFDVSSISADYDMLEILVELRSTAAVTGDNTRLFFNNDTTDANYSVQVLQGSGTTASASRGDFPGFMTIPGASATANEFGRARITIFQYAGSQRKTAQIVYGERRDATTHQATVRDVNWENTAAINRIMIRTDNHSTDLFVTGSRIVIIGWKEQTVVTAVTGGSGVLEVATDNVSSPPTDAELDTAFGTPATVGAGFHAALNDNNAGTAVYLVLSDGTNWWYQAMTKAT